MAAFGGEGRGSGDFGWRLLALRVDFVGFVVVLFDFGVILNYGENQTERAPTFFKIPIFTT